MMGIIFHIIGELPLGTLKGSHRKPVTTKYSIGFKSGMILVYIGINYVIREI